MPFGVEQHNEILLGSAFLQVFYSFFDLETNSFGFLIDFFCHLLEVINYEVGHDQYRSVPSSIVSPVRITPYDSGR